MKNLFLVCFYNFNRSCFHHVSFGFAFRIPYIQSKSASTIFLFPLYKNFLERNRPWTVCYVQRFHAWWQAYSCWTNYGLSLRHFFSPSFALSVPKRYIFIQKLIFIQNSISSRLLCTSDSYLNLYFSLYNGSLGRRQNARKS